MDLIRLILTPVLVFLGWYIAIKFIAYLLSGNKQYQYQFGGKNSINIQNGGGVSISNSNGHVTINGNVKDVNIVNTGALGGVSITNKNGSVKLKGKIKSCIVNGEKLQ